jgi:hypothetical protein
MTSTAKSRCPNCDAQNFVSVQSAAIAVVGSQDCKRAYEVKYQPDGTARLVSV